MKIHCLQHTENPGRTYLPEWAARHGHSWECTLVPSAGELSHLADADCVVVLGGPMSAWDEQRNPWLRNEKRFIEQAVVAGQPVLGICLGAQILADVLGARTYKGAYKEIGWFEAEATPESRTTWVGDALPARFETFFWHEDTYDLPDGAVHIARSGAFENQGFIWKHTLALQFHLEVNPDWVRMLANRDAQELVAASYTQTAETVLGKPGSLYRRNNAIMDALLQHWLRSVGLNHT